MRELLARVSSRELSEWMAYERITGPLDERWRADYRSAIVAATVANSVSTKGRAGPRDFMPEWDRRPKTPEEIWQDVLAANAALGGTVRDKS